MRDAGVGPDDPGLASPGPGTALHQWLDRSDTRRSDAVLVALLATVCLVGLIARIEIRHPAWPAYRDPDLVGALLVLGHVAPLLLIRRHPATAFAATGAAYLLGHLGGIPPVPAGAVFLLVLYLGIVQSRDRQQLAAFSLVFATFAVLHWLVLWHLGLPIQVMLARTWVALLVVAAAVTSRNVLAYRRRVAEAYAAARVRSTILRDLHDGVTHGLTAMVVQADAARARLAGSPDRADDGTVPAATFTTIASIGRESLADLRRLLRELDQDPGPLREVIEDEALPPAGLANLPGLLARATCVHGTSTLTVRGRPRPLPTVLDQALFRVVQEAVTNALRHADAPSAVTLRYRRRSVEVVIDNDDHATPDRGPAGASGRGAAGMRSRVIACGGTLSAGPRRGGGYRVRARVPA